jgi:hypothetical protein
MGSQTDPLSRLRPDAQVHYHAALLLLYAMGKTDRNSPIVRNGLVLRVVDFPRQARELPAR